MFRYLVFIILFAVAACSEQPENTVQELQGQSMGTTYSIKYFLDQEQAIEQQQLQKDIDGLLEAVNRSMSTYLADSEISFFNRAAVNEWVDVSTSFITVARFALDLCDVTNGAFDPTSAELIQLWGFDAQEGEAAVPSKQKILQAKKTLGCNRFEFDEEKKRMRKTAPVYLNLSAVAKGYAVDVVVNFFKVMGISDYLIEVGGEIYASGSKPEGEPWKVAIEEPVRGERKIMYIVPLQKAIATSGDYRNYRELDGKFYSHIIDPRTGYPTSSDIVLTSVLHDSVMMADGWATALMVLSVEKGQDLSQRYELSTLVVQKVAEQEYAPTMSGGFKSLLQTQSETEK